STRGARRTWAATGGGGRLDREDDMSSEQEEPRPAWGSEELERGAPRPRWSGRRTLAAVSIAVVIAAGGGAAIWAATANDSGSNPRGPGAGGPGPGGDGFMGLGALDTALHGEFVIADGSTELLQTGKVNQASATSLDLTSTDGYTKSYTIS